ncbi:HAD family hydrolase [Longicatena caecimuris]
MTIKLIAMDMDGTLLRSDNTISQNTKNILLEAQKKGIILALASGR